MEVLVEILKVGWSLFVEAAPYLVLGMAVAGLIYLFLSPATIVKHLRNGRVRSVIKAALLGIPLPLCSCGVIPAAASLRQQGANRGATSAFLIATPESGLDSIAVTYALLDPLMTIIRPVAAFCTALVAGITENLFFWEGTEKVPPPLHMGCRVDGCCDGTDCPPEVHRGHHTLARRVWSGVKYGFFDLYRDLAGWIAAGFIIAGAITLWLPPDLAGRYLGGGLMSMLLMLAAGIPTYICATASTPVAAALMLKGVSPGAALVFLLSGPATNVASITVLLRILGKRGVLVYLGSISVVTVLLGLVTDWLYVLLGVSPHLGAAAPRELLPEALHLAAALLLAGLALFFLLQRVATMLQPSGKTSCPNCR
jgi:uncharacterized membrane protein YraQ (UPF0718 family)